MPMFQYDEPGTIISLIRKKWFKASKTWIAPARRTATTAAPLRWLRALSLVFRGNPHP
jgi:hypothetical protein